MAGGVSRPLLSLVCRQVAALRSHQALASRGLKGVLLDSLAELALSNGLVKAKQLGLDSGTSQGGLTRWSKGQRKPQLRLCVNHRSRGTNTKGGFDAGVFGS